MNKRVKKTIILIVIGIIISLIYNFANGWNLLIHYINSTFLSGSVLLLIGLLAVVTNLGMFDHVSYSMQYVGRSFRGKKQLYEDMPDYVNKKNEKRIKWYLVFIPYIISSSLFLIISIVLRIFL